MTSGGYLVREPMRLLEAEAWVIAKLGDTPRARHSRFVGYLLRGLATELAPDEAELWELTGLVHDLDFFVADGDMHGRTTVAWLEGRLPLAALWAIAAHDHRSGVISDAVLSLALRLGDALAVLDERAGRAATVAALRGGEAALETLAGHKPFLATMIVEHANALDLAPETLAALLDKLAPQNARQTDIMAS